MSVAEETSFKSAVEDLALGQLAQLDGRRRHLQEQSNEVQEEIKAVKKILQAIGNAKPQPKRVSKKTVDDFHMSVEREAEMIRWLTGNEDEITSRSARVQFPAWADSYVNMALKMLRDTGVIRLSAQSGGKNIYRSLL
jgi:small-conductance mechanosensitive channel